MEAPPEGREGAEKEGREREGRPTARFLVFFTGAGAFFFARSSALRDAARSFAAADLSPSAIWPSSDAANAGWTSMVSASAPATAWDLAVSEADALAVTVLRTAFLGAATRAATMGVETRDIIFVVGRCGAWSMTTTCARR